MFPQTFNECIKFPGTGNGKMKRTERCLNVNMRDLIWKYLHRLFAESTLISWWLDYEVVPLIGIVISSSEHLKYTDCIMRFVQFNASLESMHFKSVQYLTWIWRIIKPSMFKTTWNILFNFFPREFDIPRYSFPSAVQIAPSGFATHDVFFVVNDFLLCFRRFGM